VQVHGASAASMCLPKVHAPCMTLHAMLGRECQLTKCNDSNVNHMLGCLTSLFCPASRSQLGWEGA
jgi:hypothetical protein